MFKGSFSLELNPDINILVGNNEAGKSTILEAIHLALTGMYDGRYIRNSITQYLFNNKVVEEYIDSLKEGNAHQSPPEILIEIYFDNSNESFTELEGNGNTSRNIFSGITFKIAFDEEYREEYNKFVQNGDNITLPIEYYTASWTSFSRNAVTPRSIPLKSALIDTTANRQQNGSDIYISNIVKNILEAGEIIDISQAHRRMKDSFMGEKAIQNINNKIQEIANISDKRVELSVELSTKNAWEESLMTYLDAIPFHFIGKGEQSVVKTKLALGQEKTKNANIVLIEEPENHLSFSKLNHLVEHIKNYHKESEEESENQIKKQIIITTHNSFVANKLSLDNLILLNNRKTMKFNDLSKDTYKFFQKLAGYDTLRLIMCKKAILVEGDSDELVVAKTYMAKNAGRLPIEDEIDVISVGTSFLRFLEIAEMINTNVAVVTDNDNNIPALEKKYKDYIGNNKKSNITIHYDSDPDYRTLEPQMLNANDLGKLNEVFGKNYQTDENLLSYMESNKTECALKIFEYEGDLNYPQYIINAIADDE